MAQRIARLEWSFILPPLLTVRKRAEPPRQSKQIGACAALSGFLFSRAK
jgi:hypothetical protein